MDELNFNRLGVDVETFGSHSLRKGSSTFAASGCTVAPSMAAICNQAGWKMGGTRDKYIKFENAGDQFLGRVLTGLNPVSSDFALSCPYFDTKTDEQKKRLDFHIKSRLGLKDSISDELLGVIRYCFASVCYHFKFLSQVLQPTSQIKTAPLLMNIPEDILKLAKVDSYHEAMSNDTAPRLTGIPPHVIILNQIQHLNGHVTECSDGIVA